MRPSVIVFLILNVLLFVVSGIFTPSMTFELSVSIILVGLVGIPHGAIDHVLFLDNNKAKTYPFYLVYFLLMVLFSVVWVLHPGTGLLTFLVLSAYHFGQSQFSRYESIPRILRLSIYLAWGISILSGLIVYHQNVIVQYCLNSEDMTSLAAVFSSDWVMVGLIISSLATLIFLLKSYNNLSAKSFLLEIVLFLLIHVTFYFQSLLVGFAIYFSTLHSLDVLKQEYAYLKDQLPKFDLKAFLKMLIPYTGISLVGIALLMGLSYAGFIPLSMVSVIFISIAALTLPHSIVMEQFYTKRDAHAEGVVENSK